MFAWSSAEELKDSSSSKESSSKEKVKEEAVDAPSAEMLMKQELVVSYLKFRVRDPPLSAAAILDGMRLTDESDAVDLRRERGVDQLLSRNRFVRVDLDEEGERLYSFVPAHDAVVDRSSLLEMVASRDDGVPFSELEECYADAAEDIEDLIVAGDVIAVFDQQNHSTSLFPRREKYLVQLKDVLVANATADYDDGDVLATSSSTLADVRRGDAVRVGGEGGWWRRVGSRVSRKGSQPRRAQRPPSVTSTGEMHSQNVYCQPFTEDLLPLWPPLYSEDDGVPQISALPLYRHGVSNDVRALWLETAKAVPMDHADVLAKLDERRGDGTASADAAAQKKKRPRETRWQGAAAARAKAEKAREKAANAKKRRLNNPRLLRLTNTHLKGTEIGDALMRNDERTKHLYEPPPDD